MNRFLISHLAVFVAFSLEAQLPKSDIYLFEVKLTGAELLVKNPVFCTHFNQNNYNNQPAFFDYNIVYINAATTDSSTTDIYSLDFRENNLKKITNTPSISEFSPTLMPSKDRFSVVRIESDGKTQSLWTYPLNKNDMGYRLLDNLDNVGYHAWISDELVALFLVDTPHRLSIGNIKTKAVDFILDDIGRCLKVNDDGLLYFVHKIQKDIWLIKNYDHITKKINTICQMPTGSEDFEILKNGMLVCGQKSKLMYFYPGKQTEWIVAEDLAEIGINNITRIASARDRLILVNSKQ